MKFCFTRSLLRVSASPREKPQENKSVCLLRRAARVAEVVVGELAGDAAAGGALQEADLDQVGLVEVLDRAAVLGDR